MRRTGLLALIAALAGAAGCRTCGEREGFFHRLCSRDETPARFANRDPDCRDQFAASSRRLEQSPGWDFAAGQGPIYPVGNPFPVGAGIMSPANELPLPRIAPPGVPEGSPAQPSPAVPNAALLPAPSVKPVVEAKQSK